MTEPTTPTAHLPGPGDESLPPRADVPWNWRPAPWGGDEGEAEHVA